MYNNRFVTEYIPLTLSYSLDSKKGFETVVSVKEILVKNLKSQKSLI